MKLEKWYEKAAERFDILSEKHNVVYENTDDGLYFANKAGHYAMFLPGQVCLSCNHDNVRHGFARLFEPLENHHLAVSAQPGRARGYTKGAMYPNRLVSAYKLMTESGAEAVISAKYKKLFPANALFYVSAWNKPILVALEEHGQFHTIGIVMGCRPDVFKPNED